MVKVIWTHTLKDDIRTLGEEVFQYALENDQKPIEAENSFQIALKEELIKVGSIIQRNPFIYQAYSISNPTRRGIIFNGNFILEYQLNPVDAKRSSVVSEVIFTSLVAAKSKRYKGAYADIEIIQFDDLLS